MKKIKLIFDKIALIAALGSFVLSAGSCDKESSAGASTPDPVSSFTAEEVKIIKENLLKDGNLERNPYHAVINTINTLLPVKGITEKAIVDAINKGDKSIIEFLTTCALIVLKADKSGYELDLKLAEARKLTPEAVEFANSFSKALKSSSAFNTVSAIRMQVGANSCNVIGVSA